MIFINSLALYSLALFFSGILILIFFKKYIKIGYTLIILWLFTQFAISLYLGQYSEKDLTFLSENSNKNYVVAQYNLGNEKYNIRYNCMKLKEKVCLSRIKEGKETVLLVLKTLKDKERKVLSTLKESIYVEKDKNKKRENL